MATHCVRGYWNLDHDILCHRSKRVGSGRVVGPWISEEELGMFGNEVSRTFAALWLNVGRAS